MTAQQQRQITVGVLTSVIGVLLLAAMSSAWERKADKGDFDLHVQDVRNWRVNHVQSDSAWRKEQRQLTLDILCELKPQHRECPR